MPESPAPSLSQAAGAPSAEKGIHAMAPLIRFTLLALYLALVLPLPLMAPEALRPLILAAVPLGLVLVVLKVVFYSYPPTIFFKHTKRTSIIASYMTCFMRAFVRKP